MIRRRALLIAVAILIAAFSAPIFAQPPSCARS